MKFQKISTFGLAVLAAAILLARLWFTSQQTESSEDASPLFTLAASGLVVLAAFLMVVTQSGSRRRRVEILKQRFPEALVFQVMGYGLFAQVVSELQAQISASLGLGLHDPIRGRRRIFVLDESHLDVWPVQGDLVRELRVSTEAVVSISGGTVDYAYGNHPALHISMRITRQIDLEMVVFRDNGRGLRILNKREIEYLASNARTLSTCQKPSL